MRRCLPLCRHPFAPQWLPSVTFNGADSGVVWNNWSPRLGVNYDLSGSGKTILRSSFTMDYGQLAPGGVAGILSPVTEAEIDFGWRDLNGDRTVQPGEVDYTCSTGVSTSCSPGTPWLYFGGNYNPNNPSFVGTANTVDSDIKNDRTREFIAGFDHELFRGFAVGATYIWRNTISSFGTTASTSAVLTTWRERSHRRQRPAPTRARGATR